MFRSTLIASITLLFAAAAFGQATQPSSPPRAAVLESLGRAVLSSHGDEYLVLVSDGKFILKINNIGNPIRISAAEGRGDTMDWYDHKFDSGEMTGSGDEMKELTLHYSFMYPKDEAKPQSRRAKADDTPEIPATATAVLRVYADKPGLHVKYTLTNNGEQYVYYLLPWINGSAQGFTTPGDDGPVEHEYAGKYADVSVGEMPWVLVERDDQHLGLVFPDAAGVFVGEYGSESSATGSIYLNAMPRYPELKSGESMTVDVVFLPAESADEVIDAAKAYGAE